ncbi:MAG: SpoIIE family protein phosphatase [Nitrospinae bacterium]|nr:SpoIIE family protein phosphatase [Nitrospinota bacterium]
MDPLHLKKISILYVEDEESIREKMEHILLKRIKNLYMAENGKIGLELFMKHSPDIIITDIRMPIMNGLEMSEKIRSINKEIPIVVTSAFNEERYLMQAISIGIKEYIKKPIQLKELIKTITSLTETILLRNELHEAQIELKKRYNDMKEEMEMAAAFQRSLLPLKNVANNFPGIDITFSTEACSDVSGDFLIVEELENKRLAMMIVDVMGHGVGAGLVTIEAKTIFDELKRLHISPSETLKALNERVIDISGFNQFFTTCYAVFDLIESTITIASAGSVPIIYYDAASSKSKVLPIVGTPIGLFSKKDFYTEEITLEVNSGDIFIMQTDGYIEALNKEEVRFDSLTEQNRIRKHFKKNKASDDILNDIKKDVIKHLGNENSFDDDVSIIIFRKE